MIEVGLGGRLDATNIVEPEVSVITSIGMDHCEMLGDTFELIAGEKAGIIKPGRPWSSAACPRRQKPRFEPWPPQGGPGVFRTAGIR